MAEQEATEAKPAFVTLASRTVDLARQTLGDDVREVVEHRGETTIIVAPARIAELCLALRDAPDLRYDYLADLTAVDWDERIPRYDVVYHLMSITTRAVIRLKLHVGDEGEDQPEVPTVTGVWVGANWLEREVFDLFGISFTGHPDMRRILMPEDWTSHPLRKDYPISGFALPDPHWAGQVPLDAPLPTGTGQQTLRSPTGVPNESRDVLREEE
jgi:NADH-quinone oxidoreductase subunit C